MAIVILGQTDIFVGELPYFTNTFPYRDSRAYAINVDFFTSNFSAVYSFIRIYTYVLPSNGFNKIIHPYFDLEIIDRPQLFYLPLSPLLDGDGDLSLRVERISRWQGGGNHIPVNITLNYDDGLFTNTWLT